MPGNARLVLVLVSVCSRESVSRQQRRATEDFLGSACSMSGVNLSCLKVLVFQTRGSCPPAGHAKQSAHLQSVRQAGAKAAACQRRHPNLAVRRADQAAGSHQSASLQPLALNTGGAATGRQAVG